MVESQSIGSYDTGAQDWAAIEAAAITEGNVLVYANTSKVEKAAEAFMEKYPGIKVQAFDLGGDDVLLKTVEEQKAGLSPVMSGLAAVAPNWLELYFRKSMSGAFFRIALQQ